MTWSYEYTPVIWLTLLSVAFLALMGFYGYRHRTAPGAVFFTLLMVLSIAWVLANGLGVSGTNDTIRIFWFKIQTALMLPIVTVALCFAVEYAGLGKWLTRARLTLLSVLPTVFTILIFTNEIHHLAWVRIWSDGVIYAEFGPAHWGAIAYGYFLSLLHLMVLAWLFVRSPRHRWIAAGLIIAPLSLRVAAALPFTNWNPVEPLNPMVVVLNFALLPYVVAIYHFRMFEVVPVARDAAIERMSEGMMVLDDEYCIADANETLQSILGVDRSKMIGSRAEEALIAYPSLLDFIRDSGAAKTEVILGHPHPRWYQVSNSPVIDRRGFQLGHLVWFQDITEQKHIQTQILDHQRTMAILKERELLARELHDGIGQMLAAAHLQAKSASDLLAKGETGSAASCLRSLADVTQEAKESVRTYLLGVKAVSREEQDFLSTLRKYLDHYSRTYGIHTELVAPPELDAQRIAAAVRDQLQPIIQEALTNVRRHGGVSSARVIFAVRDGHLHVAIEDEGRGFDLEAISEKQGFGLRSMRGRAEAVGCVLNVNSTPGTGTRVIIQVPWEKGES